MWLFPLQRLWLGAAVSVAALSSEVGFNDPDLRASMATTAEMLKTGNGCTDALYEYRYLIALSRGCDSGTAFLNTIGV